MKQNTNFTQILQAWINTPDAQKDWAEGAVLLLQLTGNQIMYRNISVNPKGKAEFIKGQLQKYLKFRLQKLTNEEVNDMQTQVDEIVKSIIKPTASIQSADANASAEIQSVDNNPNGNANPVNSGKSEEFAEFKAGKRTDHDQLPDEIKALYVENLDIVHRMRELHLKLRTLSLDNATCPDSERYPFLKEIIALDKRLHQNWDTYDHYIIPKSDQLTQSKAADQPAQSEAAESTKADKPKKVAKTAKTRKKAPLLKD